ncbi:MAG: hypothetical protein AAF768_09285 [Pseudomonadota bacterium]
MDLALQSRFYANVPVWLWPFVFAQLLALSMRCDETGRGEGLLSICRVTGHVDLLYLSDDPRAPKPWTPEQVWDYVRPLDRLCRLEPAGIGQDGVPRRALSCFMVEQIAPLRCLPIPARLDSS